MKSLKIKSGWLPESGLRMDASYHLGDGPISKVKLKKSPFKMTTLEAASVDIFKGNIFKRCYVNSPEKGYPFLSPSDMMKADINGGKYVSKKYTDTANLLLKKGWILVSRSGTLGNVVYTNDEFEGMVGSDDLIRILPNNKNVLGGYLYAYLASKYGYALLTQSSYGGVVKHIEPHHIKNLSIPIMPDEKQKEIHDLIVQASELRVEANGYLKEAHNIIEKEIQFTNSKFNCRVSINELMSSHQKRFEANYYAEGKKIISEIQKANHITLKDSCKTIFRPGIFKRHYVENGIEFLGGSDIVKSIPSSEKKLSIKKTSHLADMQVKENWILVTCGGTIGYSVIVNEYLAGKTASQHILRIIAEKIRPGYLFAFLSSDIGLKAIQSYTYGSVIPQIEPHHLERLPIPLIKEETMECINDIIMKYKKKSGLAILLELKAINLIEKEIESWQE